MRSIRKQMMVAFSLVIIIPFIASMTYAYLTMEQHITRVYTRYEEQTGKLLANQIHAWRDNYENESFQMLMDNNIVGFLRQKAPVQPQSVSELRSTIRFYYNSLPGIESIVLVDKNTGDMYATNDVTYGENVTPAIQSFIRSHLKKADQEGGQPVWDSTLSPSTVVLYREVNDNGILLGHTLGYLFIVIDRTGLENILQQRIEAKYNILLRSTTSDFQVGDVKIGNLIWKDMMASSGTMGKAYEHHGLYYWTQVSIGDWQLLTWVSQRTILSDIHPVAVAMRIVASLLAVFAAMAVFYLSFRISRPLAVIRSIILQLEKGNLSARVPYLGDNEIGRLGNVLNRMCDNVLDKESRLKALQLQTLEYQINPHFLYNTLDVINMLARQNHDPQVAELVTSLARLFRLGLAQGREMITVAEEVAHVSYYLKIQSIRFDEQLTYEVSIDDTVKDVLITKFILQPVAENSINHGIRKNSNAGTVHVNATMDEEGYVVLKVEDDGIGMSPDQIVQILHNVRLEHQPDSEKEGGFGLRNVYQRLKLHYGNDFGFQIESTVGVGTCVTIRLPPKRMS
ncbi:MAG: sensor histidine kinase [Alicyclobacillus sp.]|nr:sensor histidine kinase [Alicyclobacillus sp.]